MDNIIEEHIFNKILEKINDQELLEKIAINAASYICAYNAFKKITDLKAVHRVARKSIHIPVRKDAVSLIKDEEVLFEIATKDDNSLVRKEAVANITNERFLREIAVKDINTSVRYRAVEKITDSKFQECVAYHDSAKAVRKKAIEKITNLDVLCQIIYIQENEEENRIVALERVLELIEIAIEINSDGETIQKYINLVYNINEYAKDWYIKAICLDFIKNIKK